MSAELVALIFLSVATTLEASGIRRFLEVGLYTQAVWKGAVAGVYFGLAVSLAINIFLL